MMMTVRNALVGLTLLALLLTGCQHANAGLPRADLDGLVALYKKYELPLPPADAPLLKIGSVDEESAGENADAEFRIGFLLRPAHSDRPAVALVGTEEYQPAEEGEAFATIEPDAVKAEKIRLGSRSTFEVNAALAAAIQCKVRGWNELAERVLARSLSEPIGSGSIYFQPAELPPRTALAHLAMAHWGNELLRPDSDRAVIAGRIRKLLAAEPALATEANEGLLHSLEAALVPSRSKPGSIDASIDGLVDFDDAQKRFRGDDLDPRYLKVSLLGFAAVPALIDHLDDSRLTRSVKPGFNNFPTWHQRVGDVVSDLLQQLSGDDLGENWLDWQQGYDVQKASALAWWKKAQRVGEEGYAVAHVLPADPAAEWPNDALLRIIKARYPNQLPGIYRTMVDQRPTLQTWPVCQAITESGLPPEQKLSLFLHGAGSADLEHRRAALSELKALAPEKFVTLLVKTLDGLPATPAGSYWDCREGAFAHLVMETDDFRAWDALKRAARRADIGLRMEMLNPMDYTYIGNKQRRHRVEFLAAFLDDAEIRDKASDPKRFDGPYAGFSFPRLSVRDFAAMEINALLDVSKQPQPRPDWTADQWLTFRARAKAAATRELLNVDTQPSK